MNVHVVIRGIAENFSEVTGLPFVIDLIGEYVGCCRNKQLGENRKEGIASKDVRVTSFGIS